MPYNILAKLLILFCISVFGCNRHNTENGKSERVLHLSAGGQINTLDPAMAADLISTYMCGELYDRLLEYDYLIRPYKLKPSMLTKMPTISSDMKTYSFELRNDLYFIKDKCFGSTTEKAVRKITSQDVVFSLLRLADKRLHSPGFWLIRHKIRGIDKFRELCAKYKAGDMTPYEKGCEGFKIIDKRHFKIYLTKPDPRFLYALAMPYTSIVSRKAVEFYKDKFAQHPVGSGAFVLQEWIRNYRIIVKRNPEYRYELFKAAESYEDRTRPLPLIDRVECYLIKQEQAAWLMFLQGELDFNALSKDNFLVVTETSEKGKCNSDSRKTNTITLCKELTERGIRLICQPVFRVNYIGFCFTDKLLGENLNLRKAISLAYNIEDRVTFFNNTIIPANGPIPPGVAGYEPNFYNPYSHYNLKKAKYYLRLAGFPNGLNPTTGKPLEFTFDQGGTSSVHRQLADLMVRDMQKIGIKIKPILNSRPRFFQKSRKGKLQLFRLSWIGDYPDAENFLQLFYGPNAGACNRTFYRDKKFDKMFEEILSMPDCKKRTQKYKKMARYITTQCPWIFESYSVSFTLIHSWLENYVPHDFAFSYWKYLSLNPVKREKIKKSFKPIFFSRRN